MLAILNFLKKLMRLFIDMSFMGQIIFTVIILAFSLYWFMDLVNYQYLAFLTPVADNITEFMHAYFEESLNKGANNTDGSLFLFIMFLVIAITLLSQLKTFSSTIIRKLSRLIDKVKTKKEDEFNAQLRAEADQTDGQRRKKKKKQKIWLTNSCVIYIQELKNLHAVNLQKTGISLL